MVAKRDFTDRFLKAIKPAETGKRVIIYDAQIPGFGIRITDRSTKECTGAFVLVTRFPGSHNPVATPNRRLPGYVPGQGPRNCACMARGHLPGH